MAAERTSCGSTQRLRAVFNSHLNLGPLQQPDFHNPHLHSLSHIRNGGLETQKPNPSLALMVLYGVVKFCRTDVMAGSSTLDLAIVRNCLSYAA